MQRNWIKSEKFSGKYLSGGAILVSCTIVIGLIVSGSDDFTQNHPSARRCIGFGDRHLLLCIG